MKNRGNGCVVGRDAYNPANAVCLSCRKQDVPCPFAGAVEKSPVRDEISQPQILKEEAKKRRQPNKTEAACGRMLQMEFPEAKVVYEPMTLHLDNGHDYTPDWGVFHSDGGLLLVEAKGIGKNGYKHPSHQRAKVAYDQCRLDFPHWKYRWAEKRGNSWTITE